MIEIIKYIKSKIKSKPNVGIILGSGLSQLCTQLENKITIKYSDIPSFIDTTVDGHAGEFVIGNLTESNQTLMFANGRFHYYEGIDYEKTHIIIDIFYEMGCKYIITTNSSGCLQSSWAPGDLMIIDSHIDATFRNTPSTPIKVLGNNYYNPELINMTLRAMEKLDIKPRVGTYGWTLGPTYETPAEVKMLKGLDISAVGMSTVPEIERTHELELKLLSLACLTNYAVGISSIPLTHDEVVTKANESGLIFSKLIIDILKQIEFL